jgi:choice-of-anchor C domain-containing protein
LSSPPAAPTLSTALTSTTKVHELLRRGCQWFTTTGLHAAVALGDTFGFEFSGSNGDFNSFLRGSLKVGFETLGNGGFEKPTIVPAGFNNYVAPSTAITDWDVTGGSVDHVDSSIWPPHDGLQSLDLDGFSPGTISQSFGTIVGQTYVAEYQVSANPNPVAVVPPAMTVSVDGSILATVSHPLIGILHPTFAQMAWATHSVTFTATAATTTLEFASTDGPSSEWGIALDGVSVLPDLTAPPPPAPATDFSWGAPDPFTLTVDPGHTANSGVQSESDGAGVIAISASIVPLPARRHGLARFRERRDGRDRARPRGRQRRRRAGHLHGDPDRDAQRSYPLGQHPGHRRCDQRHPAALRRS